jgi:hypothetical protein
LLARVRFGLWLGLAIAVLSCVALLALVADPLLRAYTAFYLPSDGRRTGARRTASAINAESSANTAPGREWDRRQGLT